MQEIIEKIRGKEWLVAAGHFDFFGRGFGKIDTNSGKVCTFYKLGTGRSHFLNYISV